MSITSGFFNSVSKDRLYNARQISEMFCGIIDDGIVPEYGDELKVSLSSGLKFKVGTGRCWFNNTWLYNDASLTLTASSASSSYNRYDAVIIEIDLNDDVRAGSIKIVEASSSSVYEEEDSIEDSDGDGIEASDGTAIEGRVKYTNYPTLSSSGDIYQYPLAYIYREIGETSISSSNIIDMRGTDDCPLMGNFADIEWPYYFGYEDGACGYYDTSGTFQAFGLTS